MTTKTTFRAPNASQSVTIAGDGLVTDSNKGKPSIYKKKTLSLSICHPVTRSCPRCAFARSREGVLDFGDGFVLHRFATLPHRRVRTSESNQTPPHRHNATVGQREANGAKCQCGTRVPDWQRTLGTPPASNANEGRRNSHAR